MQHQILTACDSAAAAAEVTEEGGKDLPHQLAAESMLAAASNLLSASLPFLRAPASHLGVNKVGSTNVESNGRHMDS